MSTSGLQQNSVKTDLGILSSTLGQEVSVVKTTSEVTLDITGLPAAREFAETLLSALTPRIMRELPDSISLDRVSEAFDALVYLRIKQVSGKPLTKEPGLHYKKVEYPAFLFPLLRAIGEVNDVEDAVLVKIQAAGDLLRFDDDDYDWSYVVETLRVLSDYGVPCGMELAYGLPKGRDGRLTVMVLCVENERVKSSNGRANPADLLIRSALDFVVSDYVWGAIRWEYQTVADYRYQYSQLIRSSFRVIG